MPQCRVWSNGFIAFDVVSSSTYILANQYKIYLRLYTDSDEPYHLVHPRICRPLTLLENREYIDHPYPVSILRKSISGRHRPVRVADGPMTARCRFT